MAHMSEQEQGAIEAWLQKNKPTRYPTGYSSIYDEFGNKRVSIRFRLAGVAKKIRAVHGYASLTYRQIAEKIAETEDTVKAACKKHRIAINGCD